MAHSVSHLPRSHREFADRVCRDLTANDEVEIVYGNGSQSPLGERFVALRLQASWDVVFDFGTGRTYSVTVELPEPVATLREQGYDPA